MKKFLTVFLVALALFSFIGCDNSTPNPEDQLPAIPDKIEIPSATESLPQDVFRQQKWIGSPKIMDNVSA